ncbi:MAG: SRPBCC family protein [Nocardioidaceae bacterium]
MRLSNLLAGAAALVGTGAAGYVGLVTGRLSLDLGVGRRTRPLGPLVVDIAAPREVVYAAATAPYAERRPRAMAEKVQILERGDGMVLAAHRTPVGGGLVAVTVETVTFTPPERIDFRLVRGPVPYVAETFELEETASGTRLNYTGELGTDLGALGQRWGDVVGRSWVATVRRSLETIRAESERRSAGKPTPRP